MRQISIIKQYLLLKKYYKQTVIIPGLGENQDPSEYQKSQPDLIISNYHKYHKGLCFEPENQNNCYQISQAQKHMRPLYKMNGYLFKISIDYDEIISILNEYMKEIRIPCRFCLSQKRFKTQESYKNKKNYFQEMKNI